MTVRQAARLHEWLETHWNHGPCPVCAAEDAWFPAPNLGQVPNLSPFPPEGGKTVPVVIMACSECGHMVLINAIGAGVVVEDDLPEELPDFHNAGDSTEAEG